ncbi:MAG: NifU family protein [Nitrospirota bacterium]|jgi:Fe-S cluster biogenesis protein NfuA
MDRGGDIERIKEIIEEVKPQFTLMGGDVEFMDVQGEKVRIRPVGYCYR